jgi:threonine/homoserine/homoserine lactone efflux protein
MAASSVAAFACVSFLLVIVPGADWAYAIASGLGGGSAIPAVGGLLIGYAGHTAAVMAGVAALIAANPAVLSTLTAIGAAYLVWLGAVTAYKPTTVEASAEARVRSARAKLLTGVAISGLNPKALVLFLALLPQFTDRSGGLSLPLQIGILGLTHILNCAVVYMGVALLAGVVLRTRPGIARGVSRASGIAMIAVGVLLFAERVHS